MIHLIVKAENWSRSKKKPLPLEWQRQGANAGARKLSSVCLVIRSRRTGGPTILKPKDIPKYAKTGPNDALLQSGAVHFQSLDRVFALELARLAFLAPDHWACLLNARRPGNATLYAMVHWDGDDLAKAS